MSSGGHAISLQRFDALCSYARNPMTLVLAEEMAWFATEDEAALGVLIRDRTDNDFGGVVMARDKLLRYRAVDLNEGFSKDPDQAKVELLERMLAAAAKEAKAHHQGDEQGSP